MIAVSRRGDRARIALLHGDVLAEYWLWNLAAPDGIGDVYTGRVEAVMPAMAGRFVTLGAASGFLPDSSGGKNLALGSYVAVQITRAAQGGKGPRLAVVDEPLDRTPKLRRYGPGPLIDLAIRHPEQDIVLDDYALIAQLRPVLGPRMRHDAQAFDAVLEEQIAALADGVADLPRGAKLHITPAPAAVLIDVDSSAASGMEPLALNTAMVAEICRQIVLRNLSGGILIDFAGMKASARKNLAAPLRAALAGDFLRPEFLGFSHLGFAEIARRRIRPPLHEILAP